MFNIQSITYDRGKLQEIDPVRQYVSSKYENYLQFSTYHCTRAGIEEESVDVLNEVIISLLERYENDAHRLITTKSECGRYKEIDVLVLRMIRLNVYSPTSPYQHKFKPIQADKGINWQRLRIIDDADKAVDRSEVVMKEMQHVRWVLEGLNLTPFERKVFMFHFFDGRSFQTEWQGQDTQKHLYETYHDVMIAINEVLFYYGITSFRLIDKKNKKLSKRQEELAQEFVRTHRNNDTPAVVLKQMRLSKSVVLKQMRLSKWVFEGLDLTNFERDVFKFRFFDGKTFQSEWDGPERAKTLSDTYNTVLVAINEVLFYYGYTNFRLIDKTNKKLTERQEKLANQFVKTHKVSQKTKYSLQLN